MTRSDPGQLEMQAKARRRRALLAVTFAVLAVLSLAKWMQGRPPDASASHADLPQQQAPRDAPRRSNATNELVAIKPIAVKWDVILERDFFMADRQKRVQPQDAGSAAETTSLQQHADQALQLQAIVTGEQPSAILNGEHIFEGDSVMGFTVVRIEYRRVQVERDEQRVWIRP